MFKQFKTLLLIVILVTSVTMPFATEAGAALNLYLGGVKPSSIDVDLTATGLGLVGDWTWMCARASNFTVDVHCLNPADNSPNGQGEAFFPNVDLFGNEQLNPAEVSHSGKYSTTITIDTDSTIIPLLAELNGEGKLCVNPKWTWQEDAGYTITSFFLHAIVWKTTTYENAVVEANCTLSPDGTVYNCTPTCGTKTTPICTDRSTCSIQL